MLIWFENLRIFTVLYNIDRYENKNKIYVVTFEICLFSSILLRLIALENQNTISTKELSHQAHQIKNELEAVLTYLQPILFYCHYEAFRKFWCFRGLNFRGDKTTVRTSLIEYWWSTFINWHDSDLSMSLIYL